MKKFKSPIARLNLWFIIGTAAILLVSLLVANTLEFTLVRLNISALISIDLSEWYWILIFAATSIVVGLALAFLLGKIIFKPINTIVSGMTKLSEGNFSTRIDPQNYEGIKCLAQSFNTLAEELEKTEILRADFVNYFSHEIKTPIVSISGLISLMKSDNVSDKKKKEYLTIMEEEAHRLTQMTSNALYLSKIETQGILTNKNNFNVSEQIRDCVLLLERKWSKKDITPTLDFDEYIISANEDMLKQVWLNIIDNAIKFSEPKKEIIINSEKKDKKLSISITNYGPEISESDYEAIFNKFFQCDKSRATEGNGIGLSIVKHIVVTLHGGDIKVMSGNGKTTFTVILPI